VRHSKSSSFICAVHKAAEIFSVLWNSNNDVAMGGMWPQLGICPRPVLYLYLRRELKERQASGGKALCPTNWNSIHTWPH